MCDPRIPNAQLEYYTPDLKWVAITGILQGISVGFLLSRKVLLQPPVPYALQ